MCRHFVRKIQNSARCPRSANDRVAERLTGLGAELSLRVRSNRPVLAGSCGRSIDSKEEEMMVRLLKRFGGLLLLQLLLPAMTFAQGAITGVVRDTSGG